MELKETKTPSLKIIDSLGKLLEKNVELTLDRNPVFFPALKIAWKNNCIQDNPKTIREFLQTTLFNAQTKRVEQKNTTFYPQKIDPKLGYSTISGNPVRNKTELLPNQVPNAFYVGLYHWKNQEGAPKPEPLDPVITAFTGHEMRTDENFLNFLKRLESEKKGKLKEKDIDEKRIVEFEYPVKDIQKYSVVGSIEALKREDGQFNTLEIIADIKLPFEVVEDYLQS